MFGNYIHQDSPNVTKYEDSSSLTKMIVSGKEFISNEKHEKLIKNVLSIIGKISYKISLEIQRNNPINLKNELNFILDYVLKSD